MNPSLSLGTAQFGSHYGITNKRGLVLEDEVAKIICLANERGIKCIDTAQSYGISEEVLGLNNLELLKFKIISKLPAQTLQRWSSSNVDLWEQNLKTSLTNLGIKKLDSLLLHRSSDFIHPDKKLLIDWLQSLKDRELILRIGVSIYSKEELKYLPLDKIEVIQLPLSIYDQRLLNDGTINYLNDIGVSIHARSIFLQGLTLQEYSLWPSFIREEFKLHHQKFESHITKQGISLLEASLSFIYECQYLESCIVGVTNQQEFIEILKVWNNLILKGTKISKENFLKWQWNEYIDLDPRRWN